MRGMGKSTNNNNGPKSVATARRLDRTELLIMLDSLGDTPHLRNVAKAACAVIRALSPLGVVRGRIKYTPEDGTLATTLLVSLECESPDGSTLFAMLF